MKKTHINKTHYGFDSYMKKIQSFFIELPEIINVFMLPVISDGVNIFLKC